MNDCAVKTCKSKADPRWYVYDVNGRPFQSCDGCGQLGEEGERAYERDELECHECGDEGFVEEGPYCFRPASDCCGGCFKSVACSVCGDPDGGFDEPDPSDYYDDVDLNAEVEWESRD